VTKDFTQALELSSLRVEGEVRAKLTIGAIDARPEPPVNPAEIDKRIEALKDQRENPDGASAAAEARRKFAERFAADSPAGLGEKGEARPLAGWRAAFAAVAEEVANADTAIPEARPQAARYRPQALAAGQTRGPDRSCRRHCNQSDAASDLFDRKCPLEADLRRPPRYRRK